MNTQTLVAGIETELDGTWADFTARPESITEIVINDDINPNETGGSSGGSQC